MTSSWGGKRYHPVAFTEYGVAMLSGLLNSETAVKMNIEIVRSFIQLRKSAIQHSDLNDKIQKMERHYNRKFADTEQALDFLIQEKSKEQEYS
ncbi:MAG: hypothetical protein U0073_04010 [Bacteroidia bacterium]